MVFDHFIWIAISSIFWKKYNTITVILVYLLLLFIGNGVIAFNMFLTLYLLYYFQWQPEKTLIIWMCCCVITVFFHVIDKWYKLLRFFPFFSITWHTIRTNHLQKTTKIDSRTQITKRHTNTTNEKTKY